MAPSTAQHEQQEQLLQPWERVQQQQQQLLQRGGGGGAFAGPQGEGDADLNLFELYIEILGNIAQWKRQGVTAPAFEQLRREFSSKGPEYFAMREDPTSRAEWARLVTLVDASRKELEAQGDAAPEALQSFFPVWDQFRTGVEAVQKLQNPDDLRRLMEQSLCGLFSPRNKGHASKLLAKARDKHQVMAAASSISAIAASKLAAEYRTVSDDLLNSGSHLQTESGQNARDIANSGGRNDPDTPSVEELDIDASERATLELLSSLAQFKSARALLTPRRAALTPRSAIDMATAAHKERETRPAAMGASGARPPLNAFEGADENEIENDGTTSGEDSRGQPRRKRKAVRAGLGAARAASRDANAGSEAEDSASYADEGGEATPTICSVCAKEIEEKDFANAVGCDFRSCCKWFHRRCVSFEGGENVALPEPWFCHACIAPTIKHLEKVHQQSRSKGTRRSLTHLLPGNEQTAATVASTTATKAPSEPLASSSTSTSTSRGKRRGNSVCSTSGNSNASGAARPSSPKRRKYEFKNDLVLKRNPHQTTIVDLVEHGYLKPGDVISVPYLNKHRFEGVINEGGLIEFESNVFISPPSFALYCKRKIYKNKQSDRGWTSCFHGTTPLLHYRNQFLKSGKE
ncbi:MPN domain-containing protein [Hondaea fermentalgiana]|uniref:MPN domain-containing protein n=1 Tax=Hondaea fermentalgiana TaxID=2315210 RepID=A0A2R5GSZ4_9STRA|nr:MPN domain-containing protein [Hondaea fermentalgiana]|eukprot:GBG31773.1 MPN domain-containing protein [Hondaea fermentalgiana]